jgi:hypothetical protein
LRKRTILDQFWAIAGKLPCRSILPRWTKARPKNKSGTVPVFVPRKWTVPFQNAEIFRHCAELNRWIYRSTSHCWKWSNRGRSPARDGGPMVETGRSEVVTAKCHMRNAWSGGRRKSKARRCLRPTPDGDSIFYPSSFIPHQAESNHHLWFLMVVRRQTLSGGPFARAGCPAQAVGKAAVVKKQIVKELRRRSLKRSPVVFEQAELHARPLSIHTNSCQANRRKKPVARPASGVEVVAVSLGTQGLAADDRNPQLLHEIQNNFAVAESGGCPDAKDSPQVFAAKRLEDSGPESRKIAGRPRS